MEHLGLGFALMRVNKHGNLLEVLTTLQDKMYFVKQMTTSVVCPLDSKGKFLQRQINPYQLLRC
jgi:hypothetical protein